MNKKIDQNFQLALIMHNVPDIRINNMQAKIINYLP